VEAVRAHFRFARHESSFMITQRITAKKTAPVSRGPPPAKHYREPWLTLD
jgi:hypothetical protein